MPCVPLCPNLERNLVMHLLLCREKSAIVRQMCAVLEEEFLRGVQSMTTPEEECRQQQALAVANARIAKIVHNIATGCVACRSIQ